MIRSTRIIVKIILAVAIGVIVNIIASSVHSRIDLTSEKRFTLTETTVETLEQLQDTIYLQVFLGGQVSPPFNKIKNELRDLLYEFEVYGDYYIQYEFIDPFENKKKDQVQKAYDYLVKTGLTPIANVISKADGTRQESYLFPGAYISALGRTLAVNFYKPVTGKNKETNIHFATQNLEYELINAINKLLTFEKPRVGFLTDNNCLKGNEVFAIKHALREYYEIKNISIERGDQLDSISTLIIAKPQVAFSEADKFVIDQFAMNGGNIAWFVDLVNITMDSLQERSATMAFSKDLNLTDQLFKYGVRINNNLVLDNNCDKVMINVSPPGMQPQFSPAPWYFSPVIAANQEHPITKNLELIQTEFVSQIDTVSNNPTIQKTILLQSSSYAKIVATPFPVSFSILEQRPDERFFDSYKIPLGVLLEGSFQSLYKNRRAPELHPNYSTNIIPEGKPSKMLVVADGDIIKNQIRLRGLDTIPLPLGINKYTQQTFGNTDFIVNALNYMNDNSGLLNLRSRELTIRLLNKNRIMNERAMWQILNVGVPILLIILIGFITNIIRKRRFGR